MIIVVLLIGFFAELIYFLGILHLYYPDFLIIVSLGFLLLEFYFIYRQKSTLSANIKEFYTGLKQYDIVILLLLILLVVINYIGAISPELAFDALWYHLTLPKLYLSHHQIWHIPGGLLYYSDMPKLGEMLYVSALSFGNETLPKLLQFLAGIAICLSIYQIAKKYLNQTYSLLAVLIFYSNIVVAWESTTAYIDLIRSLFEITALWSYINFNETRKVKILIITSLLLGFAVMSKLIALGSVAIFSLLLTASSAKLIQERRLLKIFMFIFISMLAPLPWFIFSYIHTGNPFYPFFTRVYPTTISLDLLNPLNFVVGLIKELTMAADPISPIYLISIPLIIICWKSFPSRQKLILYYSILALFVWYITPRTGGGRFLLPYLPAFSISAALLIKNLNASMYHFKLIRHLIIVMIVLISFTTIVYRGVASIRYIPVVIGQESKAQFLTNNLNFHFGDFYDTDGYFANHIKSSDKVLLIGFHNLYYVDFPFIDSTWLRKGEKFDYIATQNTNLPDKYKSWKLVYKNKITMVNLYKKLD